MFGGYERRVLLPFGKVKGVQSAWRDASSVIDSAVAEEYKSDFCDDYSLYHKALKLLGRKYDFFLKVLEKDSKVMELYGEQMGERLLNERIVFAMHHAYEKGNELVRRLDDMINTFPSFCLRGESMGVNFTSDPPATNCERVGICLYDGSRRPYMWGCMSDLSNLLEDHEAYNDRMHRDMKDIVEGVILMRTPSMTSALA